MRRQEIKTSVRRDGPRSTVGVRRGWVGTVAAVAVIAIVGGTLAQLGRLRMQRLDSVRDRRDRLEAESAARTWQAIAADRPLVPETKDWTDPATGRTWRVTIAPSDGATVARVLIGTSVEHAPPLARLDLVFPTNPVSEPIE